MTATLLHPNGIAPMPSIGNKGNKGGRVARAWQDAWDRLGDWQDGRKLAAELAPRHNLVQTSLLTHIIRMSGEGHLDVEYRKVSCEVTRTVTLKTGEKRTTTFNNPRHHAFYRISR